MYTSEDMFLLLQKLLIGLFQRHSAQVFLLFATVNNGVVGISTDGNGIEKKCFNQA